MVLRAADANDIDSLTDVACAAMPMDPQWDYRFPHRGEFPGDHWNCTRELFKILLADPVTHINLVIFKVQNKNRMVDKVIAFAVWEISYDTEAIGSADMTPGWHDRRDSNPEHMQAFREALATARKKLFDDRYGRKQLHLRILATHPDFQRQGAATRHCKWGIDAAAKANAPVTLFSSPLGQKLYTKLNFELLDTITVHVEGEKERLSIGVMIYPVPEGEEAT